MIAINVMESDLRSEDDSQELWMERGRVNALKGFLKATQN